MVKKKLTTSLSEEIIIKAKIKALQEKTNLNELIERLLIDYLK